MNRHLPDPSARDDDMDATDNVLAQLMVRLRQDTRAREQLLAADPTLMGKSMRLRVLLDEVQRRLGHASSTSRRTQE
ncbi:MAG: hypothetical protein R3E94_05840 [Burkholderiaceae bacterium]